jgi:hypothetical protein
MNGWVKVKPASVRFDADLITSYEAELAGKMSWQDDLIVLINARVVDFRHACRLLVLLR